MSETARAGSAASGARRTASVIPNNVPGMQALLSLQVAVVVIAAMYFGASVLIPVVLAVLLSFLLQPLVALLRRARLGRALSVLLSVVLALALVIGLFWLIGWQLMGLTKQLAADHATIATKVASLRQMFSGSSQLAGLGPVQSELGQLLTPGTGPAAAPAAPVSGPPVQPVRVVETPETPTMLLRNVLGHVTHPLVTALVVFVVTIFVLMQREDMRDRMIRLFGTSDLHRTTLALDDAGARLSRYFLTQLAINTAFGALITVGLFVLGVQSPLLWGILAALLRYVPYVGLVFSAAPAVLLAAASFPGWSHALLVLGLFVVVDQLLGQFLEPMLIGHNTGLSPLSVVLAAAFWGFLWGPIGLILSTPLTVCAVVLGRHVEPLRFLDVLLGDRPPLSPVESLYQRLLAGDLDEIEDQADTLLREMTLAQFFDEVVIDALRMAVVDAERAVLDAPRLASMAAALDELLHALDTHKDPQDAGGTAAEKPAAAPIAGDASVIDPIDEGASNNMAEEQSKGSIIAVDGANVPVVLCVPGAFALDPIVARMMALILLRHGFEARVAEAIGGSVPVADPNEMLCLCTAGIATRLTPARYAVRRLRRNEPSRKVIVAFWPEGGADAERVERLVGADATVSGTREMVRLLEAGSAPEASDTQ